VIRRHRNAIIAGTVVLIVLVLYATGVIPHPPDAKKVIGDIAKALGPWTYVLVGALAYLETGAFVGLVAPGETTVIVGGVIAGQGEISLIPLIGLVWLCAVLGDTTSFFIGRRLGRGFILRHGPKLKIDEGRLNQVESYFERHGGKTILIGRFIGLVRALAPFVAGSSGLAYRRFLPFSVIGCGLWGTGFAVLGYIFYRSFDRVAGVAGKATLGFGITVAFVVGMVVIYRRLRRAEERRRLAAWIDSKPLLRPVYRPVRGLYRRLVRPLAAAVAPEVRFLGRRLTPGNLGLELTTTLAIGGVGAYVFTLYAQLIGEGHRTTPLDKQLLDVADDLRVDSVVDVVKVLTSLGSLAGAFWLVLVVSVALALRRHFTELMVFAGGAVLVWIAVQLAKNGMDRPRPPMPLTRAEGSSFPSGHAAYSTIWVAAAVILARAIPGLVSRAALVGVGVGIAVVIGLSRIYLRVHYWSDVAAGWALGAAIFGACAAVALIVSYIRNNAAEGPGDTTPAAETR
jgi:membrane protein DedA with SNARE-associated domain/membrane-associated phospholipid phosphatase